MFEGNPDHYFSCGESALRILVDAVSRAGIPTPAQILDFGAGAGRVTRWLKSAFPASSIACCDTHTEQVQFLRTQFGVGAWTVGSDINTLTIPGTYDLIWVGSVITHLSEAATRGLIEKLLSACNVGGLLVLSFHGPFAIERQRQATPDARYIHDDGWEEIERGYSATGYGYADYERQKGYGVSVCTPAWMTNFVNTMPGSRLVLMASRAWDGHHDVVAIQRAI
jgi:trans-aconitate methyltransferase